MTRSHPAMQRVLQLRDQFAAKCAQNEGGTAWARMHDQSRLLLVSMATDRPNPGDAVNLPWASFTAEERDAMGAAARQLARDLSGAQFLR